MPQSSVISCSFCRIWLISLTLLLQSCLPHDLLVSPLPPAVGDDLLTLEKSDFSYMPGWPDLGRAPTALEAFKQSCRKFATLPDSYNLSSDYGFPAGTVLEWRDVCNHAFNTEPDRANRFFETQFTPFLLGNNYRPSGLFTGYYEIELRGSYTRDEIFNYPLYSIPPNLKRHKGEPFFSRKEIDEGALNGLGLELLYVDDPVQLFFLHIQGSGRITMQDGSVVRIGFAAKNGHPYTSIGKVLIQQGALPSYNLTAGKIKDWLRAHPREAPGIMHQNKSYIFFRILKGNNPVGGQGVELTPEHSLAVDHNYLPYGLPLWLDTTLPTEKDTLTPPPYRRLMIAQDTGSAIKGPVRGDIFFGYGPQAELLAGAMQQTGQYFALLPNHLAQRYLQLQNVPATVIDPLQ